MNINKYNLILALAINVVCLLPFYLFASPAGRNTDSLLLAYKNCSSDTGKIDLLLELSNALACGDSDKLQYAAEARRQAKRINWLNGKFHSEIMLARVSEECRKDHTQAIQYFLEAAATVNNTGNKGDNFFALNCIAITYERLARYREALEYFREALALKTNPEDEIGVFGNMGVVYSHVGDYARALACYDSSLVLLDESIKRSRTSSTADTLQMAGLLIQIGDLYLSMASYDKALENYNSVLKLSVQTQNKFLEISGLMGMGKVCEGRREYAKAIGYYDQALTKCGEGQNPEIETNLLSELGNIYLEKGELGRALEYAQKSLGLAEKNSYFDLLPTAYTTLGKIYTTQKKYPEAVAYLQKAVAICDKNGELNAEKDALEALSHTYKEMNEPALALDAYMHYITIRDSVFNISKANELTRMDLQAGYSRDSLKHADAYRLKMQTQQVYTYSGFAGLALVLLLTFFIYRSYSLQKKANATITIAHETIKKEKQVSENLLLNILPEEVAKELKSQGVVQAKLYDHTTVLFTDFVSFTEAAERNSPQALVAELHACFMAFDEIISKYRIEKIKTMGDAYIAVSGLPQPIPGHATEIVKAAIEIRDFMIARKKHLGDKTFEMRMGINSGNVVAGIVGVKKFAYDIWGDTVNIAARMEQYGEKGKINISQNTYELVKNEFNCKDRGEINAKHKGKLRMYFVESLHAQG